MDRGDKKLCSIVIALLVILILIVICIIICCYIGEIDIDSEPKGEINNWGYISQSGYNILVDDETCVEYFEDWTLNIGEAIVPRYNQDGTLKVNEECMEESNND